MNYSCQCYKLEPTGHVLDTVPDQGGEEAMVGGRARRIYYVA